MNFEYATTYVGIKRTAVFIYVNRNVKVKSAHKAPESVAKSGSAVAAFVNRYRDAKHGSRVRKSSDDPDMQIHKHMPRLEPIPVLPNKGRGARRITGITRSAH